MPAKCRTTPRYMLVGAGLFAQKTYIPHLQQLEKRNQGQLVAVVEVKGNEGLVQRLHDERLEFLFVSPFTRTMPLAVESALNRLVDQLEVDCVIISTEPLAHKAYGLWAIHRQRHVIMDKPITTRRGACTDSHAAEGIARDYEELRAAYDALQRHRETCFLIQSHRRYHPGFHFLLDRIQECQRLTGCPITSMTSTHCDGMWRMPREIVDQDYHPFKNGYGKISHSGYHLLDICSQFMKASWGENMFGSGSKTPDRLEIIASFITPMGFYAAVNGDDYQRIFGPEYASQQDYSDAELTQRMEGMGEYDCALMMTAYRGRDPICLAQLNLLHDGFSRRSSSHAGDDLYRGVGRVKHETHDIKSGPFQTLVAETRKSNSARNLAEPPSCLMGGDNHFDVHIFRNHEVLKTKGRPVTSFTMDDILGSTSPIPEDLSVDVKQGVLQESYDFMTGRKDILSLRSNLPDHELPATIMGATYLSHVRRSQGQNPIVTIDLEDRGGRGDMRAKLHREVETSGSLARSAL